MGTPNHGDTNSMTAPAIHVHKYTCINAYKLFVKLRHVVEKVMELVYTTMCICTCVRMYVCAAV